MAPLTNLQTRAVETLLHPYTNQATFRETGPLVFERGKGVYIYDADGKAYLEGMAGLWCTALGYDNEELVEAAAAQMRKLPFAHLFTAKSHDPAIELAEKLKEIAPVPISKVFFSQFRIGSERHPDEARLVHEQCARPPEQEEDHQPGEGLSWRDDRVGLAHRAAEQPHRLRPADRARAAHVVPAPLSLRQGRRERGGVRDAPCRRPGRADPEGRPGHGRGLHRRAGDGRGRRDRAAEELFSEDHGGVRQV